MILSFSKHLFLSTSPQHRAIRRHRARQRRQRQRRGRRRLLRRGAQQRQQVAGRAGKDGDLLQLLGTRKKTAKNMGKIGKMWEETVKQHGKNNQQKWGKTMEKLGSIWIIFSEKIQYSGRPAKDTRSNWRTKIKYWIKLHQQSNFDHLHLLIGGMLTFLIKWELLGQKHKVSGW